MRRVSNKVMACSGFDGGLAPFRVCGAAAAAVAVSSGSDPTGGGMLCVLCTCNVMRGV